MPDLLQNADPETLESAVALNHQELMIHNALASGGEVRQSDGVTWTFSGPKGEAMILFPRLQEDRAGEQIDKIIRYYLERRPEKLVGCWSLDPTRPRDLGVRLLARGFQPGWRPCWMALDMQRRILDHAQPEDLTIEIDGPIPAAEAGDLPFANPDDACVQPETMNAFRDRSRRFVARTGGKVVGHSRVFLTTGPLGVAGIYDVGVTPDARNRGVGKAVTTAACRYAQELGYHYALLNATGRRMYEQIEFEWIGDGWTWWLNVPRLSRRPPTPDYVALAEAVGRGDLNALTSMEKRVSAESVNAPLACGMTLLQLAASEKQPESAEWLYRHGAEIDVITAWDLGWKERLEQILAEDPERVNQRLGEMNTTPLHEAVERDDIELARFLLAFHPDLNAQDSTFQSTPSGWARHLNRQAILDLIEGPVESS